MVILAGGRGTRVKAIAGDKPKALLAVAGRPFIDRQLELLARNGFGEALLCLGYGAGQIETFVGDGARWGLRVEYVREDPDRLLGTGGAMVNALPRLAPAFAVMYGDSYLTADFRAVARAFDARGSKAMMTVFRNEGRWDRSNARVEAERVVFYSKTASPGEVDCIDYGLLLFRRAVIERYAGRKPPLDMSVIIQECVAAAEMDAYVVPERFYEIGKPEGLAELDALLRKTGAAP